MGIKNGGVMRDNVVEGYKEDFPSITPPPERSLKKRARGSSGGLSQMMSILRQKQLQILIY